MGVSLFDHFFDSDYTQRSDINDAAAAARDARFYGDLALENVEQLRKQVLTQRDEIRDLSIAVSVLVRMLGETGTVDDKILRYRVEAALEERIEAAKPNVQSTMCVRCKTSIVLALTQMTEDGPVCDRCVAGVK